MGLFNYSKPGPGIEKDAPKKKGVFLFFEIFFRKFWKLCQVTMLHFICSLPIMIINFFLLTPGIVSFLSSVSANDPVFTSNVVAQYTTAMSVFIILTLLVFCGSGPASAGSAYIHRCFAREEHAWIWSDFFNKMKENFKQGMLVAVADIAVINLGLVAMRFYYNYFLQTGNDLWFILLFVLLIFLVIFVFSNFYIYQLMVTFESGIVNLFKNSFIMALATMPVNIILSLIIIAASFFFYMTFEPIFAVLLSFLLISGLFRFMIEFYASSVVKKKILNNMPQTTNDEPDDRGEN
ncbi:MAG: DUF624 domain-containing protein [Clostridia bacterium]|nr:DUF624 domain-containing protein [Clostridia bacterium]